MPISFIIGTTKAYKPLSREIPSSSLISGYVLTSLFGILLLSIFFQVNKYYFYFSNLSLLLDFYFTFLFNIQLYFYNYKKAFNNI